MELEALDYFSGSFFESREFSEALGIVWGFGSLLLRHRDKSLIERFCSLVKITGNIFPLTTQKDKIQWAVTVNIGSLFVQRIMSMGYRNIAHIEERPMPQGDYDRAVFLRTYAQLHYIHDTIRDQGLIKPRIRFNGSTAILESLNRHLHEELGCSMKKIQNHKVSAKTKLLYYQSKKEVPKVLLWLNEGPDVLCTS
ncbi:hypothetical protein [Paenibacillus validus]|uniref:hypothetical protein n=1 Tax=Paenibacillus validus TaxID=44253 RepID=UPI003D2BEFAF